VCDQFQGPGTGGCYYPEEFFGVCGWVWSTNLDYILPFGIMGYGVDFSFGRIDLNVGTFTAGNVLCVR